MARCGQSAPVGRPLVIPLFIPHRGCPHRCVFCNQRAITDKAAALPSRSWLRREVTRFLKYPKTQPSRTQICFFGGSFLGLHAATIRPLLDAAKSLVDRGRIDEIGFSTRPDTIRPETLAWLDGLPVGTVELGAQSMRDHVLTLAGRGHRAADTVAAVTQLKTRGYRLGLQMMVGLPADDEAGAMETARRLAALEPDFIRIYPTLVLKNSPLARHFKDGRYRPMSLDPCVTLVKRLYLFFNQRRIPVARMGLQASAGLTGADALIAGPYHPAFGHLVHAEIARDAITAVLAAMAKPPDPLMISLHPSRLSRLQGMNQTNIQRLKQVYGLRQIVLLQDATLAKNRLVVAGRPVCLP